jgi:MraZ protein
MFIGEYKHTIDQKRRIAIPVKFRKDIGKKAVITKGLDKSLFLYSQKEWGILAKKLSQLPFPQANARGFSRIMLSGAVEVSIDNVGRILIPDYLKEYASLKKSAVVVGVYNRIEIWDQQTWNSYKKGIEKNVEDIAEKLQEIGS